MAEEKVLTVMADYDCGLWDGEGGMDPDDEEINAPPEFVKRFDAWVARYDMYGAFDTESFNQEGRALAVELKKIVGPSYRVLFKREPDLAEEEILEPEQYELPFRYNQGPESV